MSEAKERTLVCRCEEVTEQEIKEAIQDGAKSLDDIKRRTRAGMGLCQGRTCRRLVAQILARERDLKLEDIPPSTYRPPVRLVKIGAFAAGEGEITIENGEKNSK